MKLAQRREAGTVVGATLILAGSWELGWAEFGIAIGAVLLFFAALLPALSNQPVARKRDVIGGAK